MHRALKEIARDVRSNWDLMGTQAESLLAAMEGFDEIRDTGQGIVTLAKFRWAARTWRGPVAQQIKNEIDGILKAH